MKFASNNDMTFHILSTYSLFKAFWVSFSGNFRLHIMKCLGPEIIACSLENCSRYICDFICWLLGERPLPYGLLAC